MRPGTDTQTDTQTRVTTIHSRGLRLTQDVTKRRNEEIL